MDLYLIRHGKYNPMSIDPYEGLSDIGKKETIKLAILLKQKNVRPDIIYSSNKKRSVQTAQVIAKELGYALEEVIIRETLNPNADPLEFLSQIAEVSVNCILIISHLPLLPSIIHEIAQEETVILPSSVVKVNINCIAPFKGTIEWVHHINQVS